MKKSLGVGSVRKDKLGMAHFLVRDTKSLIQVILPIFDSFPLLTSKEFSYIQFKNCLHISKDSSLTMDEKFALIEKEKKNKCPETFIPSR